MMYLLPRSWRTQTLARFFFPYDAVTGQVDVLMWIQHANTFGRRMLALSVLLMMFVAVFGAFVTDPFAQGIVVALFALPAGVVTHHALQSFRYERWRKQTQEAVDSMEAEALENAIQQTEQDRKNNHQGS